MPNDKADAQTIQRKYDGKPQALAQHLVSICLNKTNVVKELFFILNNFSTLDVGYRFVSLIPTATLSKLVGTKNGKAFCELLLNWLKTVKPENNSNRVAPDVDAVIQLIKLKNSIDNATAADESEENPYYTIDAGIVLEADAIAILDKIAPLYFAKVGEKFNVNSGTRNSYRQAEAMYIVYMNGDRTLHLYNRQRANELIAIIKKGESKAATIKKMTDLIQQYADKGIFMSDHQKAGAIDISIRGDLGVPPMTNPQQKIMMEIATKVTGYKALLENSPPHIHLKFK
jgi:hypothetical protein